MAVRILALLRPLRKSLRALTAEWLPTSGTRLFWRNWAGNVRCQPTKAYVPDSEDEIIAVIRAAVRAGARVKVVGAGHSCSRISACTGAYLVSLDRYNHLVAVDQTSKSITVQAGMRLADLNRILSDYGLAVPSLGVIDAQSIAGAISTGTHGTGLDFGTIASYVTKLRLILPDGNAVDVSPSENCDLFHAARVGLGSLAIISTVTLACVSAFNLHVQESPATLEDTILNLDEHLKNERFGFWWFPHTDAVRLWTAVRTERRPDKTGKRKRFTNWFLNVVVLNRGFEVAIWLVAWYPRALPTINRYIHRTFYNRSISHVMSSADGFRLTILVRQYVLEYALPLETAAEALYALKQLISDRKYYVHHPIDVRFGAADEPWLSPAQGRLTCYIGVIMYRPIGREVPYECYFRDVDALFASFGGRPHWGKVHYRKADYFRSVYPHWHRFLALRHTLDPQGLFLNDYLEDVFGLTD